MCEGICVFVCLWVYICIHEWVCMRAYLWVLIKWTFSFKKVFDFNSSVYNNFSILETSMVCDSIHHTHHVVCTSNHDVVEASKQLIRVIASIDKHTFGIESVIHRWMLQQRRQQQQPDHCIHRHQMIHLWFNNNHVSIYFREENVFENNSIRSIKANIFYLSMTRNF